MKCFLVLQKPLLVDLCVVVWVLFCEVFLTVAETIVGWPVCCCVGIVLGSVSWCCRNHCCFACVLLCRYCFVKCLLVLQKPLLFRLCDVVWVLYCGVFLGVVETIVGSPVCCYVGIVLWSVSWCCGNHCWLACVLVCWYCFVECFLVLRKPLLVGLCVVMLVFVCGVFLGVAETIVGWPVCCYVGIVQCLFNFLYYVI